MTVSLNIETDFAQAMAAYGLEPAEVIADGKLHRFDGPEDKRGKKSAWYVLHSDALPAGTFGDWKTGLSEKWSAKAPERMTPAERDANRKRIEESRAAAAAERALLAADAAAKVQGHWEQAAPLNMAHDYVKRKRIKPFGAKQLGQAILVPLRDSERVMRSAQYIQPNGTKTFKSGGVVAACYCTMAPEPGRDGVILICEGWATACTLREATGYATVAAMNAGNLIAVAKGLREKVPSARIVICGDDDHHTEGNPGLTKAYEAADAVGGIVAMPDFGEIRPEGATDWNDLGCLDGLDSVRTAIESALSTSSGQMGGVVPATPTPGSSLRPTTASRGSTVMLSRASDITPEAISWLWPAWLPIGKLSLLAGSPGTGKTTLALALAAAVSRGSAWPDGSRNREPGTVLMWSSEDDPADTLVPRLMAAGADLTRIHFIRNVSAADGELLPFDPSRDMSLLGERLGQMGGAQLLILDPIVSAVAGDAHRVNDVRRDLQGLVDMASAFRCAVLGISHFAKGGKGTTPAERVIGSQAFVALARMVLVAAKDEAAERRILARAKSNIAPDDGGIAYTLEQVTTDGIEASRVVWGDLIEGSARDILGDVEETDDEERSGQDEAQDFLAGLLADGPVSARELKKDADGAGYNWKMMQRAASKLGVEKRKVSMKDGWEWALSKRTGSEVDMKGTALYTVSPSGTHVPFGSGVGLRGVDFPKNAEGDIRERVAPSADSSHSTGDGDGMAV